MSGAFLLLKIAGFVALLLWGTHMVTSGVLRGFGGDLRQRIGGALSSTPRAFFSGIFVTLALQSSTATGLMASSFAAHGILAAAPGFVLMLGANVGTALVTQIFAFPAVALAAPLFLFGYLFFRKSASTRWRNAGRALIGVGLMFLSLHELVSTFRPLGEVEVVREVLGSLESQVFLALLIGAVAAWLCHSSVAVVLLVLSLATGGVLPLSASLAMVLGANLGGAVPPVMEADGAVAKRLPLGNLLVRAVGVALGMIALPAAVSLLNTWGHTGPRTIVDAHVLFNIALAIVALPFSKMASAALVKLLPDPPVPTDPGQPRYMDKSLLSQSHLALASVEREVLRLSDVVGEQLYHARQGLFYTNPDAVAATGRLGDSITSLGRAIQLYIADLPTDELSVEDQARVHELVHFVINLEHVGDLIPHHLVEPLVKREEGGELLDEAAKAMLEKVMDSISEALGLAVASLLRQDLKAAKSLIEKKVALRDLEQEWVREQPRRVAWPSARTGAVEVDVVLKALRECRRIHAHLTSIAEHLLNQGERSRQRPRVSSGS